MDVKADIFAKIHLYDNDDLALFKIKETPQFRCSLALSKSERQRYIAAFLLDGVQFDERAGVLFAPIKLAFPEFAKKELKPGARFYLWYGRWIGEGVVCEDV